MKSRELRIAAVADYLVGKPVKQIHSEYGVASATLREWINATGHFKYRLNTSYEKCAHKISQRKTRPRRAA